MQSRWLNARQIAFTDGSAIGFWLEGQPSVASDSTDVDNGGTMYTFNYGLYLGKPVRLEWTTRLLDGIDKESHLVEGFYDDVLYTRDEYDHPPTYPPGGWSFLLIAPVARYRLNPTLWNVPQGQRFSTRTWNQGPP